MSTTPHARRDRWIRGILTAAGVIAFALVLRTIDVGQSARVVAEVGPLLALALVPYLAQIAIDSHAWGVLLTALGRVVPWRCLVEIRLSTEAVLMSVPGGSVVAETLKPYLLQRLAGVPPADTIATIGAKKYLMLYGQAAYLGLAVALGWAVLASHSHALIGAGGLPWIAAGAVVILAGFGVLLSMVFVGGAVAARLHRLLRRIPIARFQIWIDARHAPFAATDASFAALGRLPRRHRATAGALLTVAWLSEAAETYVLLRLVGVDLPVVHVLVMEALVVSMRYGAFFVPAGLGVQDAGYLAFLRAYGVGDGPAGAFVIVKRAKEVAWVAIGYALLFLLQTRAPRLPSGTGAALASLTESP